MKQNSLQMFLVSLLSTFLCSATMYAQGLYQNGVLVNKTDGITMPAGGSCTIRAELPTSTIPTRVEWTASGGIYFYESSIGTKVTCISSDFSTSSDLVMTIRSKDGVTKEDGYSMFAKGVVTVRFVYNTDVCVGENFKYYITGGIGYIADVYKTFDPVAGVTKDGITYTNNIAGELCASQGKDITFSVEPWVSGSSCAGNFDEYSWSGYENIAVDGTLKYTSNDNSSITFTVKDDAVIDNTTITCNIGKKNTEASKTLTFALMEGIAEPTIVLSADGDDSYSLPLVSGIGSYNCIPYELEELAFTITDKLDWAEYSWEITKNGGTQVVDFTIDDDGVLRIPNAVGNNYTIALHVNGGSCSDAEFVYNINRQLPKAENIDIFWNNDKGCVPNTRIRKALRLRYFNGTTYEALAQTYNLKCEISQENDGNGWSFSPFKANLSSTSQTSSSLGLYTGYANSQIAINIRDGYACQLAEPIVKDLTVKPKTPTTATGSICVPYPVEGEDNSFEVVLEEDEVAERWHWLLPTDWSITTLNGSAVVNTIDVKDGKEVEVFETTTNKVTIVPNGVADGASIRVKAFGQTCETDWTTMALGYAYPNPTIEVDGCLVPGGRVHLTAVGGSPNAMYSWNVSGASDESAISDGTSLNNSSVYFNVAAKGPSMQYPIYLTTTNSCSSDNIVTKDIDVTSSYYVAYSNYGAGTLVSIQDIDNKNTSFRSHSNVLYLYRISSDGSNALVSSTMNTGTGFISSSAANVGESFFFRFVVTYDDGCEEVLERTIEVPSDLIVEHYLYKPEDSNGTNNTNGTNKSLRITESNSIAFPNPTDGIFTIPFDDFGIYDVNIFDMQGSLMKSFNGEGFAAKVDISTFPMGDYVYVAYQNGKSKSGIILKK